MRILPIANKQHKNSVKRDPNFTAKKIPEINNPILAAKMKAIIEFFSNPKNDELIKQRNEASEKIAQYIEENINVKPEVLNTPFGPVGNKWPHERG